MNLHAIKPQRKQRFSEDLYLRGALQFLGMRNSTIIHFDAAWAIGWRSVENDSL
jgi:hypothetical protein